MTMELSCPFQRKKIFVGNLPSGCKSSDLEALFKRCGNVVECDVLKRYAFVHMSTSEEAIHAVRSLNNYVFMGSCLTVQHSKSTRHPNRKANRIDEFFRRGTPNEESNKMLTSKGNCSAFDNGFHNFDIPFDDPSCDPYCDMFFPQRGQRKPLYERCSSSSSSNSIPLKEEMFASRSLSCTPVSNNIFSQPTLLSLVNAENFHERNGISNRYACQEPLLVSSSSPQRNDASSQVDYSSNRMSGGNYSNGYSKVEAQLRCLPSNSSYTKKLLYTRDCIGPSCPSPYNNFSHGASLPWDELPIHQSRTSVSPSSNHIIQPAFPLPVNGENGLHSRYPVEVMPDHLSFCHSVSSPLVSYSEGNSLIFPVATRESTYPVSHHSPSSISQNDELPSLAIRERLYERRSNHSLFLPSTGSQIRRC